MIENFAEDEKRGFFSARSWNRTVVFFCLACFFLLLYLEKELVLSPLFFIYGVFSEIFVSAVQVLA